MRVSDGSLPLEVSREAKFVAFGLCVFLVVLLPGLLFYKSLVNAASSATAAAIDSAVRAKHQAVLDSIHREIDLVAEVSLTTAGKGKSLRLNRQIPRNRPLDLAMLFDKDRKLTDGITKSNSGLSYEGISLTEGAKMVPVDAGFFDSVRDGKIITGMLEIGDRPFATAIREIETSEGAMFFLIGRVFDGDWYAVQDAKIHDGQFADFVNPGEYKLFRLSDDVSLTDNSKMNLTAAMQNRGWSYSLTGTSGLVFTVFDDLLKRPTIMVQTPWSLPSYLASAEYYRNFFVTSLMSGILGWWLLRRSDWKSRSRTRRFEGLSGLSKENLKIMVEAFPGYAFALTPDMKYLAASRVLAGVTGQEPSEFIDRQYGEVCFECDDGLLAKAFSDLRDQGFWPPVRNALHGVTGLGESHKFSATAHYMSKQDVLLVLLSKTEGAQNVRPVESFSQTKKTDSAVA